MAWKIDNAHSRILFAVRHMMISTVRGEFKRFSGAIHINEAELAKSSVDVQIDAASIDTNDPQRDAHLKSPDFLDVENHPYLTFKSKHIEQIGNERGKIYGDLTIRGITHEIVLDTEFAGMAKSPWGQTSAGFEAETGFNRSDWGLEWNKALETGGVLVGDEIKITIELEAIKEAETQPEGSAST
jgi:polyisoprenoid-binding protein YceI